MTDLVSCRVMGPEEWAKASGYDYDVHTTPLPNLTDFYMDPAALSRWQKEALRFFRTERNTAVVTHARNASILTQAYDIYNGTVDEKYWIFSEDNNIRIDDLYWLQYMKDHGILNGYSHSEKEVWVDFSQAVYHELDEPIFFLGSRRMWGHWLTDFLPSLKYWHELPDRDRYKIATGPLSHTQFDTLMIYGVQPEQVIQLPLHPEEAHFIKCPEMIVPQSPPHRECYSYSRKMFGQWGKKLLRQEGHERQRVYLTRANLAPNHRVSNEEDVAACLAKRGIKRVAPSSLPLVDQLDLLTTSDIVVTPYGSGLGNACISPIDSVYLHFIPLRYWFSAPHHLIETSNYPYWFTTGLPLIPVFADAGDGQDATFNAQLHIDLDQLNAAVDRAEGLSCRNSVS